MAHDAAENRRYLFLVNVEVVIVRDERYLMIERGKAEAHGAGWLGMPGGTVEWDKPDADTLENTARREVMEEVGMPLAETIAYVESHTFALDAPVLDVVVLAQPATRDVEPYVASPGEVASVQWMGIDEICADPRTQPWTRTSLQRADQLRVRLGW